MELYESPELEIFDFSPTDIIATSIADEDIENNDDEGTWDENW